MDSPTTENASIAPPSSDQLEPLSRRPPFVMTVAALAAIAGATLNLFPTVLVMISLPSVEALLGLIRDDPTGNHNDHSTAILLFVPWIVVAAGTVVGVLVILQRARLSKPWIGMLVAIFVLLAPAAVIIATLHLSLHDFFPWLFS